MLMLLLACTEIPDLGSDRPGGGSGEDPVEDTGHPSPPDEVPTSVDPRADALFTLEQVHEIAITLSEDSVSSLGSDPYTYVPADLVIDGDVFERMGVRIKGRVGSYRSLDGKSGFKLDANAFVEGGHIYGLEKLNLNNMVQDSAQAHEYIAYRIYELAGLQAPRVGYAWVTLNGADYGLYTLVEAYDQAFIDRHFGTTEGNLYDGDYIRWEDGSYTMIDFETSTHDYFELDEGRDVGLSDIYAITDALVAVDGGAGFQGEVGALVDLQHFARHWAVEAWVGQYDGYTYNQNNYRVYFSPDDHLARLFPWDHDWAFYSSTPITSPDGLLSTHCKADEDCHAEFLEALDVVGLLVEESTVSEDLDTLVELITPYVEADPRKETDSGSVASSQEALRSWLESRSTTLAATGGL